jgi:hypothetical protein
MTLYFGMDHVSIDAASGSPRINVALTVKAGGKVVKEIPAGSLFPWPQSPNRIFYLDQFDLAGLAPGAYFVEATLRDLAKKTTVVNTANFSIQ